MNLLLRHKFITALKQALYFLLLIIFPVMGFAMHQPDSTGHLKDSIINTTDTLQPVTDTVIIKKTIAVNHAEIYAGWFNKMIKENLFLNSSGTPVNFSVKYRDPVTTGILFYILLLIVGLLSFFRYFNIQYFKNLFRVFFNTSLKQSQLADQLLQSNQPSLLFNILFIISSGFYLYLMLLHYHLIVANNLLKLSSICIASVAIVYLAKFLLLKFTGWITDYKEVSNMYIFIIFLINKILGILLIPFSIIIAFSDEAIKNIAINISVVLISLMLLLRFFRAYGSLQHKIKVSRFHFFMYIIGVEIIPLLLLYKGVMDLLSKNI